MRDTFSSPAKFLEVASIFWPHTGLFSPPSISHLLVSSPLKPFYPQKHRNVVQIEYISGYINIYAKIPSPHYV